jgi:serine/threonine protein kinase/Tol biopolymer transport system component
MPLASGTKLGPYEIQAPLGAGGMGEVYRARDTRLDRIVAIKVLSTQLSENPEIRQRFEREARAISSLNHPNICHLYDIGSQDGTDFLVMEFLEGETLHDHLRKGPARLAELLKIGTEVSEALEVAHRSGIVHRDLKPGNVMLTKGGAKLMDFGLAKPSAGGATPTGSSPILLSAAQTLEIHSPMSPLTTAGSVVGTIQYMSPEQLEGSEVDARSDIFALGALLYEMATGKPAFSGKSQITVASAILEKDPEPVSTVNPLAPAALDYLVATCLAKDREQRFQSAHDVRLQLQWIGAGSRSSTAQPEVRQKSSRLAWIAAGALALLAIAAGVAYLRLANRPVTVVRSSILPPPGTTFRAEGNYAGPAVLAPDGTRMTFTARDDKGKTLLYVRALTSSEARPLTGTDGASFPFWSPDGRSLGFFAEGKLKKIDADGGPTQTLCDASAGRGGTWGKDGTIVFSPSQTHGLMRIPAAGGTPEPASNLDASKSENSHRWPYFLPDGKHFLYWVRSSRGPQEHTLCVGTLGSLQAKVVTRSESMAVYASGYLLFLRGRTLMAQPFNAQLTEIVGDSIPVVEHVVYDVNANRAVFSTSENGMLIYEPGDMAPPDEKLAWFTREGKESSVISQGEDFQGPALSPDGTHLAVAIINVGLGTENIWIFDLQRGTKMRLTFGGGNQSFPVWTPDGKTVYFGSNAQGPTHIYAKSADGTGEERAIFGGADEMALPGSVSPDGKYLAYGFRTANDGRGVFDIWALPLSGEGKPFPVVHNTFSNSRPAVSPDGKWMAYSNAESGRADIYITAFPGGGAKWQVSTTGGLQPQWRKDGRELFFLDPANNFMAVDVSTANSAVKLGIPHVLFKPPGVNQYFWFAVNADGKKFIIDVVNSRGASEPFTLVQNWTADLKK